MGMDQRETISLPLLRIKETGYHYPHQTNQTTGLLKAGILSETGIEVANSKVKGIRFLIASVAVKYTPAGFA
jgi:hypothetical protein